MKKFIGNCLACACLLALGACAAEGPATTTTTTTTTKEQRRPPGNVDHSAQMDSNRSMDRVRP